MSVPISNVTRRVVLAASGTGPYSFNFEILTASDIAVYRDDTLLTLTTDYTVTINTNGTGYVTLNATPTGATQIAIVGDRAIQRTSDFVTGGDLFANTLNTELDSLTIFAQQNAEATDRALKAPQTDPTTVNMTLPGKADRAGKYLSFDSVTGDPEAINSVADVSTVAANVANINTVAGSIGNVNTVAGSIANVNTVGGNIANVNSVGAISANVTTVAGISANVTTVAGVASDVTTVAANVVDVTNYADTYLGPKTSDPSLRNDSSALQAGDLYFNTSNGAMKVYTGSAWVAAYVPDTGFVNLTDTQTITGIKTFDNGFKTDTISEETSAAGVTVDGVLLKDTTVTANTIKASGTSSSQGEVQLFEDTDNGTNYVALKAPAAIASNVTWTMPSADGTSGQVLQTNGSGTLSFGSGGFSGATINAPSSSALTLTNASTQYQRVQSTSTTNNVVNLPNATTLSTEGGPLFLIDNRSLRNQILNVKDNGGNLVAFISPSVMSACTLADNSTSNGSWSITANGLYQPLDGNEASITAPNLTVQAGATSVGTLVGLTSTKFVFMWATQVSTTVTVRAKVGDISGSTITFGSEQTTTISVGQSYPYIMVLKCLRLTDSAFVLYHGFNTDDQAGTHNARCGIRTCTVSGTTITFGTASTLSFPLGATGLSTVNHAIFNPTFTRMADDKYAVVYNTGINTNAYPTGYSGSLTCNIITVSGTTQTVGTKVDLGTSTFTQALGVACYDTDKLLVVYGQGTSGSTTGRSKVVVVTVSGTTPTWETPVNIQGSDSVCQSSFGYSKTAFAVSTTKCFVPYIDGSSKGAYVDVSTTTPTFDWSNVLWGYDPFYYETIKLSNNALLASQTYIFYSADGFYKVDGNANYSGSYNQNAVLPSGTSPNLISYNAENNANARVQLITAKTAQ